MLTLTNATAAWYLFTTYCSTDFLHIWLYTTKPTDLHTSTIYVLVFWNEKNIHKIGVVYFFNLKSCWKILTTFSTTINLYRNSTTPGKSTKKILWLFWWETHLNASNQLLHIYSIYKFMLHDGAGFSPPPGDT